MSSSARRKLEHRAWTMTRDAAGVLDRRPAVSLAVAKRKGANAVKVAAEVLRRLETVRGRIVPASLDVAVTRNYGETANEKANELLFHLALATVSIVVLITLTIGWREGVVTLIIIPTTILLTLFASWMMGYTINRVSLFALIFSIGILVDDAIVVVENIVRHWGMRGRARPRRDRSRSGRRGRQSDDRGDARDHRRAAADDVRQRPDGPLHEPDPRQRLDGDAVFVLRRGDGDALAAAAPRAQAIRERADRRARSRPRHRRDGAVLYPRRDAAAQGPLRARRRS